MREGDLKFLSQYAFDNGLVEVWTALLLGHDIYSNRKGPNPTRALQRSQSRTSPEFLAAWSRRENLKRDYIRSARNDIRNRRRYAQREAAAEKSNRAHLRQNLAQIEAGQHWGWVRKFAQTYLFKPNELGDLVNDPETPFRALRNCFPMLEPHIPTVESLGRKRMVIAEVLLAACLVRYRDGERLDTINPDILAAATTVV